MCNRNISTPLCLKSETSAHAKLVITLLYMLLGNVLALYQLETYIKGYPLIKGITRWRNECDHKTFPGTSDKMCNFLVEMSTFKQAIKLTFWHNKFGIFSRSRMHRESDSVLFCTCFAYGVILKKFWALAALIKPNLLNLFVFSFCCY